MIYTVTFNPSLDYIVSVDKFATGKVNRTGDEKIFAGGKGVNVSIVLKNLGYENTALGYTAGFTGNEIERILQEKCISTRFKNVTTGISRINVKLKSDEETEINGQGPAITTEDVEALYDTIQHLTELIGQMKPMYRDPLRLLAMGYTNRKIAESLGLTDEVVRMRLFRGRKLLWKELNSHE